MNLTILGNGYTTKYLSEIALKNKIKVTIVTRNIKVLNPQIKYVNFYDEKNVSNLLENQPLISTIPPNQDGIDPVIKLYKNSIALNKHKINYLSATSVYSDGTVYENTKPNPNHNRGKVRLNIEKTWLNTNKQTIIYRIAGIYGPNRNPIINYIEGKNEVIVKDDYISNRIHVEDLAEIILEFIQTNHLDKIINISDQNLISNIDAISYVSKKLNLPSPIIIKYNSSEVSEIRKSFYETNRIIKSNVIGHHFKYTYKHPYYEKALLQLAKAIIS